MHKIGKMSQINSKSSNLNMYKWTQKARRDETENKHEEGVETRADGGNIGRSTKQHWRELYLVETSRHIIDSICTVCIRYGRYKA